MRTKAGSRWFALTIGASTVALLAGCGGGGGSPDPVDDLKQQLGGLSQPATLETAQARALDDATSGPEFQDTVNYPDDRTLDPTGAPVTYKTFLQTYTVSASFDTQVLLNPGTDVIYPGSVLLGHSIDDGSYVEVTSGTKRPVTISYDLTGVQGGAVSGTIVPSLSAFRELHNKILSQDIPAQSSIYTYETTQIRSEDDLDLKFSAGAKYTSPGIEASVKSGFEFSSTSKKNKFMVRFMQTFYTVDIDQGAGTFLYRDFKLEDFHGYRPVYVASVAYGRLAYLTIESDESWETIKANLDICVKTESFEGNAEYQMAIDTLRQTAKLNITVVGGSTVATSVDGFDEFLRAGGFSRTNSGKIISYKLRFVDDNTVANTVFSGTYTVRRTVAVSGKGIRVGLRVTSLYNSTDDGDSSAELAGKVRFRDTGSNTVLFLWNYSEGGYFTCHVDATCAYDGAVQYITFAAPADQLVLETVDFMEIDNGGNDTYYGQVVTRSVAELVDLVDRQGTLSVGATYSGGADEYVTFTVQPTYQYLY